MEGILGCPNCRDSYRIDGGHADLRPPPRGSLGPGLAQDGSEIGHDAASLQALLGIVRGPGTIALIGAPALISEELATLLDEVHVVAVDAEVAGWSEHPDISRLTAGDVLPFFSRGLRGVVVDGRLGDSVIRDACRVLAPKSRIVVVQAPDNASELLAEASVGVLAQEAGTVVAARS